ncbi:MAG TPA: class I SAM-dependent methyltransferase [Solirubrobacteraceae bacterium]|nr:class I SAM-dependent methyltransferase [Solirubrobacteraceae bacterium]
MPFLAKKASASWPKQVPKLTEEQHRIQDDWMRYFHEQMPEERTRIVRFNHSYAARSARPGRTLDIGAGLGEHLRYEDLFTQDYHAVELREDMAKAIRRDYPSVVTVVADCQQRLPYEDGTFDRALAIHVLEHLPDLPAALSEIRRLLKPSGVFSVVIPCEGGLGYALGRRVTTQRAFERRYKTSYKWHIESDHVNKAREILPELRARFDVTDSTYFPMRVPLVDLNLIIGLTCVRRSP